MDICQPHAEWSLFALEIGDWKLDLGYSIGAFYQVITGGEPSHDHMDTQTHQTHPHD